MSIINVQARGTGIYDPVVHVGSFNTATALCWSVNSRHGSDLETCRIWLTQSGRWVYTDHPEVIYLTPQEARNLLINSGHRDVAEQYLSHGTPGRPAAGDEVRTRLPKPVIKRIEALATLNGIDRSRQIAAMVIDQLSLLDPAAPFGQASSGQQIPGGIQVDDLAAELGVDVEVVDALVDQLVLLDGEENVISGRERAAHALDVWTTWITAKAADAVRTAVAAQRQAESG